MTQPGEPVRAPQLEELEAARAVLRDVVVHTPLVPLRVRGEPSDILVKPEIHQCVGSFKIRGVYHAVASLPEQERARGLSTVSAGNTAQALAWCGRHFGVPSYALMPEGAPRVKIEAVRALGGTARLVPTSEVFAFLKERRWEQESYAFIHPWIERNVLLGHGSLGLEIAEDCDPVHSQSLTAPVVEVYLSVGGGGLLTGTAAALKVLRPEIRIVAVEPQGCPALATALERGRPVEVECKTICDGIAVPYITEEMFPLLRSLVDDVVLVDEQPVRAAMRTLLLDNKMLVEASGAITVAAALQHPAAQTTGRRVCVLSGGSVDPAFLATLLA